MTDLTAEEIVREVIRSDYGLRPWFETYGRILDKEGVLWGTQENPLTCNILQERYCEAFEWCLEHGVPLRFLCLKPRQKGMTTISSASMYWIGQVDRKSGLVVGGQDDQADSVWAMIDFYSQNDEFPWGYKLAVGAKIAKNEIGTKFSRETARDIDAGRSKTFQAVLATEAARWLDTKSHSSSAVLQGIVAGVVFKPRTLIALETTAKGPEGMFYKKWETQSLPYEEFKARHEAGEDMSSYFIQIFAGCHEFADSRLELTGEQRAALVDSYTDAEKAMVSRFNVEPEFIAWYRRTLRVDCDGDAVLMKQDFPMTPEEAFSASSKARFNHEGLARLRQEAMGATRMEGRLDGDPDGDRFTFLPVDPSAEQPVYWRYEPPIDGLRYIIAVDTMTGASNVKGGDADHHCAMVLRTGYYHADKGWQPPRVVCRTVVPCRWDADVLVGVVWALACYYGKCMVVPELAGMGAELIRLLRGRGCNLYQAMTADENADRIRSKASGHFGFQTTSKTRPMLIETLASAIRSWDEQGGGLSCPDIKTVEELESFVVNNAGRAEAAAGKHDDSVMTLGIALATSAGATLYSQETLRPALPPDIAKLEALYKYNKKRPAQFT